MGEGGGGYEKLGMSFEIIISRIPFFGGSSFAILCSEISYGLGIAILTCLGDLVF